MGLCPVMDGKEITMEKVYWFINSKEGEAYDAVAYYRCHGIEEFIKKVEETKEIVGLVVSGNNIGFIIKEKEEIESE